LRAKTQTNQPFITFQKLTSLCLIPNETLTLTIEFLGGYLRHDFPPPWAQELLDIPQKDSFRVIKFFWLIALGQQSKSSTNWS
jgi:hypothetical protein